MSTEDKDSKTALKESGKRSSKLIDPAELPQAKRQVFGARVFFWESLREPTISQDVLVESETHKEVRTTRLFRVRAVPADVIDQHRDGKWKLNKLKPDRVVCLRQGVELADKPTLNCFTFDLPESGEREMDVEVVTTDFVEKPKPPARPQSVLADRAEPVDRSRALTPRGGQMANHH